MKNMLKKKLNKIWCISLLLLLPVISVQAEKIRGIVVDQKNQPIRNVVLILESISTKQKFSTKTNNKGEFEIVVTVKLAHSFNVYVAAYKKSITPINSNDFQKIIINLDDDTLLGIQIRKLRELIVQLEKELSEEREKIGRKDSRIKELTESISQLTVNTNQLLGRITDIEENFETLNDDYSNLKGKYNDISREFHILSMKNLALAGIIEEQKEELFKHNMQLKDCFCKSYNDNYITVGFTVVDKYNNAILFGNHSFSMEVLRLKSVSGRNDTPYNLKNTKNEQRTHLYDVLFPNDKVIEITFRTSDKQFISTGNNYTVYLYNDEIARPIGWLDINSLRDKCGNIPVSSLTFLGRKWKIDNRQQTSNESVNIEIRDYDMEDGDVVSLYLNGEVVRKDINLKNKYTSIPVQLKKGTNSILLYAEKSGPNTPCTVGIKIDNGNEIQMSPSSSESKVIEIVRR